jgi:hypothetical protein
MLRSQSRALARPTFRANAVKQHPYHFGATSLCFAESHAPASFVEDGLPKIATVARKSNTSSEFFDGPPEFFAGAWRIAQERFGAGV